MKGEWAWPLHRNSSSFLISSITASSKAAIVRISSNTVHLSKSRRSGSGQSPDYSSSMIPRAHHLEGDDLQAIEGAPPVVIAIFDTGSNRVCYL